MTTARTTPFVPVRASLADLVGEDYVAAVTGARAWLTGLDRRAVDQLAREAIDFFPPALHQRLTSLLPRVGQVVTAPLPRSAAGASSKTFTAATKTAAAPLTGLGYYRLGEDGRLYLTAKSEHYHTSLGHSFPGYELLERARRLGIPNATHNNTRGHITRRLELELVRVAHGLAPTDAAGLEAVVADAGATGVNRVLNLETGSLAAEAALKMILARFYRIEADSPPPAYAGRVPVIVVIGNDEGGLQANYHGTTVLAQMTRDMWPELFTKVTQHDLWQVVAVRPNNLDDVRRVFAEFERPPYKVAGFFHEIILMNYGARRLAKEFLHQTYALCAAHDVPTVDDEIQSCVWNDELLLCREWGLQPGFIALGKGFPGGEYPASRLLFSARYDTLPQFGALVTNGQEEIASLAYLVTIRWAVANAAVTRAVGDYYEQRLRELADQHRAVLSGIDGLRHMGALCFRDLPTAKACCRALNAAGLDISAQTYKSSCPPVALTKLPLIAGYEVVDWLIPQFDRALSEAASPGRP